MPPVFLQDLKQIISYNISMKNSRYVGTALALTFAGTLFAGYLSGVKFFSSACAFNEPCPYFLGYPACYFGFAMFLAMFAATIVSLIIRTKGKYPAGTNAVISGLGILFAGSFTVQEIVTYIQAGTPNYTLIMPTCSYGLIFYVLIFTLSLRAKTRTSDRQTSKQK
jgi:hypothetical protein